MYAHRHTKKRGTLIVACSIVEAFELARQLKQATKTPRRMTRYTQYLHSSRMEKPTSYYEAVKYRGYIYHTHEHLSLQGSELTLKCSKFQQSKPSVNKRFTNMSALPSGSVLKNKKQRGRTVQRYIFLFKHEQNNYQNMHSDYHFSHLIIKKSFQDSIFQ